MKHFLVRVTLMLALLVPMSASFAYDLDGQNPHHLADYMLDTTDIYMASRIGADYFNQLDAIAESVYDKLPASIEFERMTIDSIMRREFDNQGFDWDAFVGLLGEYVAFGIELPDDYLVGGEPYATIVLEITDREATIDALITMVMPLDEMPPELPERDDFLVYEDANIVLYATETHLIFSSHPDYVLDALAPLSASSDFTTALTRLPADTYSGILTVSTEAMRIFVNEDGMYEALFSASVDDIGPGSVGITGLNDDVLAFDVTYQLAGIESDAVVSRDVLTILPDTVDGFIAGNNLANLYNSIIDSTRMSLTAQGEDDFTQQLPFFFGMTGLDLEDDVLSWTTGEFALFFTTDSNSILSQLEATQTLTSLPADFGFVIEATDAELARNTADKLGEFVSTMLINESNFTITSVDESDPSYPFTTVAFDVPEDDFIDIDTVELVITANDDWFYMGTSAGYDSLLAGTVADNPEVNSAMGALLDNPSSIWYLNGDGSTLPVMTTLFLFPSRPGDQTFINTEEQAFDFLYSIDTIVNHQTISSSVDADGVVRVRATLALNP